MRPPVTAALLLVGWGCAGKAPGDADPAVLPCSVLTAHAASDRATGRLPFSATLDASASCGPSPIAEWRWQVGGEELDGEQVPWTGLRAGTFDARLTVEDVDGATATDVLTLVVEPAECPEILPEIVLGTLADDELVESSGLVVSRRDTGVLWTHNDSGDVPRLFAVARDGASLGTWTLDVPEGDWEDLGWAVDPDTGAPLLFIGDTGNGDGDRDSLLVYVVEEPVVDLAAEPAEHAIESWRTLTLRLPEPLNADTVLVDPETGDLLLVTDADDGRSVMLRKPAPHLDGDDVPLEAVGELTFGVGDLQGDTLVTGGDVTPLGDRIVLRTRDEAWLWLRDGALSVAETLQTPPCPVPLPVQTLGEAVTFDIRDGGLLITSEGAHEPLLRVPFYETPECIDELVAVIEATPPGGPLPLTVSFDAGSSCVPQGLAEAVWEIDGERVVGETATATWLASGSYAVTLTIRDTLGDEAEASTTIVVEAGDCPVADGYETIGTVVDPELIETSGIVVSRTDPGILWVHNDAGDVPRVFALNRAGETLGTATWDAPRGDMEDIAAGYSEDGTPELWVGSIGNNNFDRPAIYLYRFDEPVIADGDPVDQTLTDFDTITLTYPDPPQNCETLMVDPITRDLYFVTKDTDGESDGYRKRAPHLDGEEAVLEHVTSLSFGDGALEGGKTTTGGEFSPDGAWIVVRTYETTAFIWRRDGSATVDAAFATEPCPISMPSEVQGEAVCFDTDGDALLSVSETVNQPIQRVPLVR